MIDPGKVQKELKTGMPSMKRRAIIGERRTSKNVHRT